nr:helicase-related protein [Thalassobacillus sp. C254]
MVQEASEFGDTDFRVCAHSKGTTSNNAAAAKDKLQHTRVHAEDTERRGKVQDFREGKIPLLVTTTILERGVTVKGIEVAVLGAEETIFDESALVQIAGRAGRSADHPTGDVVYFHYGKSNAMLAARRHIKQMNKANIQ